MRTQINPRMNLHGPRPSALLGTAVALVMLGTALPAAAQAEVLTPQVVSPNQVTPHLLSPPRPPSPPAATAPTPSSPEATQWPTDSSSLTAPAPDENPSVTDPSADPAAFGCNRLPCPGETDQERKQREAVELQLIAQGEHLKDRTIFDDFIGPVMCPFSRSLFPRLWDQLRFANPSDPAALLTNTAYQNNHPFFFAEYSTTAAGMQRWCLSSRDK